MQSDATLWYPTFQTDKEYLSLFLSKHWTENCKLRADLGKSSSVSEESTYTHSEECIRFLTNTDNTSMFSMRLQWCSRYVNKPPQRGSPSQTQWFSDEDNYNRKVWTTELLSSCRDHHCNVSKRENIWRVVLHGQPGLLVYRLTWDLEHDARTATTCFVRYRLMNVQAKMFWFVLQQH